MATWIEQELKEIDAYLDALAQQKEKDAGHLWIQFTDKFNAFKKRLVEPLSVTSNVEAEAQKYAANSSTNPMTIFDREKAAFIAGADKRPVDGHVVSHFSQTSEPHDFKLLEEYDMKDKLEKTITHCLTKMPEENRKQFIINLCNGMIGSAILHHNNRYVKKLIVPDFKTTFK